MKTILIAFCISFFTLGAFANENTAPQGTEPVAPLSEPAVNTTVPAEAKAAPAKREVARKRKHARAKKHKRHHHRK